MSGKPARHSAGTPQSKTKTATNVWLINVLFYDKRGNLIQNKSNNQLNYTAATSTNAEAVTDTKSSVPGFTGKPQLARAIKTVPSGTVNVITAFAYDSHNARLASIQQSYDNGSTYTTISAYTYNDLGQLVTKGLSGIPANADLTLGSAQSVASGSTSNVTATNSITLTTGFSAASGSTFSATIVAPSGPTSIAYYLQNLDYRYNIRGQLTNINNSTLTNDGGLTNSDSNDVFGMTLLYDQPDISGATASYTGRISEAKWMSQKNGAVNSPERSYVYSYDPVNRLTGATYADRVGTGSWGNADLFSEKGMTYDENGNLTALVRYANGSVIDNLQYAQSSSSPNQLASVNDISGVSYGVPTGNGSYTYDANSGNLTIDPYKKLQLTYNELNKTNTITQTAATSNVVTYGYDASGSVIRKQVAGGTTYTNDYLDGFVYQNGVLQYFAMPEGRVTFNPTNGTYTPQYVIADNQGNARITFQDSGTGTVNVMQENGYYAFGMVMPTNFVSTSGLANNNLYNGQNEWQNDYNNLPDYYQTFYRNYDAALGRFIGVDPQAESAESMTTYQYAGNNPVMMNDPIGNTAAAPGYPCYSCMVFVGGGGSDPVGYFANAFFTATDQADKVADQSKLSDPDAIASQRRAVFSAVFSALQKGANPQISSLGITVDYNIMGKRFSFTNGNQTLMASSIQNYHLFVSFDDIRGALLDNNISRGVPLIVGIPDLMGVSAHLSATDGIGGGLSAAINLITRGPSRGIYITYTPSIRLGLDDGFSLSYFSGTYVGGNILTDPLAYQKLLGVTLDAGASAGLGVDSFVSFNGIWPAWIGTSKSAGGEAGGSIGAGYALPGPGFPEK